MTESMRMAIIIMATVTLAMMSLVYTLDQESISRNVVPSVKAVLHSETLAGGFGCCVRQSAGRYDGL